MAVSEVSDIAQPVVVVAKLTFPKPDPPLEVRVIVVPATAVIVELLTLSALCAAALKTKLAATDVELA